MWWHRYETVKGVKYQCHTKYASNWLAKAAHGKAKHGDVNDTPPFKSTRYKDLGEIVFYAAHVSGDGTSEVPKTEGERANLAYRILVYYNDELVELAASYDSQSKAYNVVKKYLLSRYEKILIVCTNS